LLDLITRIRTSRGARYRGHCLSSAAADLMADEPPNDAANQSAGYVAGVSSVDNFNSVYRPDV